MAEAKKEKMVKVKLPRPEHGEAQHEYVAYQYKGYLIERGVEVEVPEGVAEVIANSEKAKDRQYKEEQEKAKA